MADAQAVLEVALDEADLLAHSGGSVDEIAPIIRLAHDALRAGGGQIPDDDVRQSGLHPTKLARLGL
jgi:hypothetical protein